MKKKCKRVVRRAMLPNLPMLDSEITKWRIRILMQARHLETVEQINEFNKSMAILACAMKHDNHSRALVSTVHKIMNQAIKRWENGITPYLDTRGKKYVSEVSQWLETWVAQRRMTMRSIELAEKAMEAVEKKKLEAWQG